MNNKLHIVYCHTNNINNRKYFGITKNSLERRSGENGENYKRGNSNNDFYLDIQKYGWNNFTHEILYKDLSLEKAKEIERSLILKSKNNNNLYNKTKGGESSYLSSKVVVQMNLNEDKIIMIWKNKMEISKTLNVGHALISQCCNKKIKHAYNYRWFNCDEIDDNELENFNYTDKEEIIKDILIEINIYRKIVQIDLDFNLVKIWENSKQAESSFGNNTSMILDCCNKKRNTSYGYYWKTYKDYLENGVDELCERRNKPKSVIQFDSNKNKIKVWESLVSASRELNIGIGAISNSCNKDGLFAGGYLWEYCVKKEIIKYCLIDKINKINIIKLSELQAEPLLFVFETLEELQDGLSNYTEYDECGKYYNPYFNNIKELIEWTTIEFNKLRIREGN